MQNVCDISSGKYHFLLFPSSKFTPKACIPAKNLFDSERNTEDAQTNVSTKATDELGSIKEASAASLVELFFLKCEYVSYMPYC